MRIPPRLACLFTCFALVLAAVPARADESAPPPAAQKSKGIRLTEAGLITFFAGYAWAAGTGAVYRDTSGRIEGSMFIPVVGPIKAVRSGRIDGQTMLTGRAIEATGANECSGDAVICPAALLFLPFGIIEYAMFYAGPAIQATGLVLAVVGAARGDSSTDERARAAAAPPPAPPRPKVSVSPSVAGGLGLSLSITQW